MPDIIRVLRVVEYIGPRKAVEDQISQSLHGTKTFFKIGGMQMTISAVTIGEFAEILATQQENKESQKDA